MNNNLPGYAPHVLESIKRGLEVCVGLVRSKFYVVAPTLVFLALASCKILGGQCETLPVEVQDVGSNFPQNVLRDLVLYGARQMSIIAKH